MSDQFKVKVAQSTNELKEIYEVRRQVFVEEQGVSKEEEYDEYETTSTHLLIKMDEKIVGTCRYRNTVMGVKLERFAVLKKFRGLGVGAVLLKEVLNQIDSSQQVYLHAQVQVVDFYTKFGFRKEGKVFKEAGIHHFKMVFS